MNSAVKTGLKFFSLMCSVLAFCFLMLTLSSRAKVESSASSEEPQVAEQFVSREVLLLLEDLKAKIVASSTDEQFVADAQTVLRQALEKDGIERNIIVEQLLSANNEYLNHVLQLRGELEKSASKEDKLLLDMEQKLVELSAQNEQWGIVTPQMEALNRQLEASQKLETPEVILQNVLRSWQAGGSFLTRSYRWVCVLPIVARDNSGKIKDAIGMYDRDDRRGEKGYQYDSARAIYWQNESIDDPFGVRNILDAHIYFAEEDIRGFNNSSKYTDVRVVGDVIFKLNLAFTNFSIRRDDACKQHITITLPSPEIIDVKFRWNDWDNGMGLIQRAPPYFVDRFATSYTNSWEEVLKKPFCDDVVMNSGINPEDFVRNIANTLYSVFESKGYVVTFAFPNSNLESLMRKFYGLR